MEPLPRPTIFDFHGVYMTNYFTDNWDDIQRFEARPSDIVIATFPKAGGGCVFDSAALKASQLYSWINYCVSMNAQDRPLNSLYACLF